MIERGIGSWDAILAIREAEEIVRREGHEARRGLGTKKLGRALVHGALAAGFLVLCFLPAITVLALVITGIFLAR